jgi:uncharacterized Zn finger protein
MTSEEIIKIIEEKKATLPCPACGKYAFTLVDAEFIQESSVKQWLASLAFSDLPSPRSLNYIVLVCDNCGYIRQHAMKPLGITPKYRRV